jgi:hypothetical protein
VKPEAKRTPRITAGWFFGLALPHADNATTFKQLKYQNYQAK